MVLRVMAFADPGTGSAPAALKQRSATYRNSPDIDKFRRTASIKAFDVPYGLIGLMGSSSVMGTCR
jgi:hypothetical protein